MTDTNISHHVAFTLTNGVDGAVEIFAPSAPAAMAIFHTLYPRMLGLIQGDIEVY